MKDCDLQMEIAAINEQFGQQIGLLYEQAFQDSATWAAAGFGNSHIKDLQDSLDAFRIGLRLARTMRAYAIKILNEPVDDAFIPTSPQPPKVPS
jgi:hypothetical protein